ncbi:signal peptidase complex I [Hyaloraphidium curvatum]|nr:signal peptidase complex I [Hyaloraphidium curvatum]
MQSLLGRIGNPRQVASQALNLLLIVCSALMIWKGLGSMEPAFHRGDLLFLTMPSGPIRIGDICVFKIRGRDVPIVHRIIKLHNEVDTGKQYLLTKGDNNQVDDRGLYNHGQMWIHKEDIVGKVHGFLPKVGMVTIIMNDYPRVKFLLLGVLGLFVVLNRDG